MKPMKIEGLKQSPLKPVNHMPDKVQLGEAPQINASINWLDSIRLLVKKTIENKAFSEFQISTGKIVATTGVAGGIGFLASINWALLLTGNPIEIIKLVVALIGFALTFFWKK